MILYTITAMIALLFLSVLLRMVSEPSDVRRPILARLIRAAGEAINLLTAIAIAALLLEVPHLRRIATDIAREAMGQTEQFTSPAYLHNRFSRSTLTKIAIAAISALRTRPTLPGEDDFLNRELLPSLAGTIRTDMTIMRELIPRRSPAGTAYVEVHERLQYAVVAGADQDSLPLPLYTFMRTVGGLPPESLFVLTQVMLDGHATHPLIRSTLQGGYVTFYPDRSLPTPSPHLIDISSIKRVPFADLWNIHFRNPVRGLSLTLIYPEAWGVPECTVFGSSSAVAAAPLLPDTRLNGFVSWHYAGWFLPGSGCVVQWPQLNADMNGMADRESKHARR